ncbi:MAG: EutN/CcmL family microcompartment protein [Bdellovibrionales bacterium]|jgi:microcompartment protein CcmK/EutM|nr:EutN/CcmL family microcompartment protein [Bdellovibrionales bacterium]
MQIGKVVGTVISTNKDHKLEGLKLQVVKYVSPEGKPTGGFIIAVDSIGAGTEEIVLVATGSSARQTTTTDGKPVDAVIMAIVDSLEVDGKTQYNKS